MSPLTDARPRPEHLFQDGGKGGTGRDLEGEGGGLRVWVHTTKYAVCCHRRRGCVTSRARRLCLTRREAPGGPSVSLSMTPQQWGYTQLSLGQREVEEAGRGMSSNMGGEDEEIPQGGWQREDGKVGKMTAEWSSVWEEERGGEGWGR